MMEISKNIVVGVEYPKLCNFYGDLRHYAIELNNQYIETIDELLVALIIHTFSEDEKEYINQIYYTSAKDGWKKYTYTSDKENNNSKWTYEYIETNLQDILLLVAEQPFQHDIQYFYQNM